MDRTDNSIWDILRSSNIFKNNGIWNVTSADKGKDVVVSDDIIDFAECENDVIYDSDETIDIERCQRFLLTAEKKLGCINTGLSLNDIFSEVQITNCDNSRCVNRSKCWLRYSIRTHLNSEVGTELDSIDVLELEKAFNDVRCYLKVLKELREFEKATVELVKLLVEMEINKMLELDGRFTF